MKKYSKDVINLVDSAIRSHKKYETLEEQFSIDLDHIPDGELHEIAMQLLTDDPELMESLLADLFGERIEAYNQDTGHTNKHDSGARRDDCQERTIW